MVVRIYPPELQLIKTNASDIEVTFSDMRLYISNGFVTSKIYKMSDDFDFDTVKFPFWMGTFFVLCITGLSFLNLFDSLAFLLM